MSPRTPSPSPTASSPMLFPPEISNEIYTQVQAPQNQSQSQGQTRSASEVVQTPVAWFDESIVLNPFNEENEREKQYQIELQERLLKTISNLHAWGATRSKREETACTERFEAEMQKILQAEQEQEVCRREMEEFMVTMRDKYESVFGNTLCPA